MGHEQGQGDYGQAGRSARREAERLRERRARRAAERPCGLLARIFGPSAAEKRELARERAWSSGAGGEELLATYLAKRCPRAHILHDRRMPRGRANIDHIAVAASGVYVIDAKRYRGKIEVRKPLFGAPSLRIAGRDRTQLIAGLHKQVEAVRSTLAEHAPAASVRGCLCFVAPEGAFADVGLPLLRTLEINGFRLYYPRRLAKQLRRPGPLDSDQIDAVAGVLAQRLPPA